ncbi:hypothetical protein [Rhodococcus tukisamuensis]|uniref:Ig-like domain (Group 3) n=1 Tax=Rhodococcus tukisamuensis TaxID=168276 RepID=A0A1G7EGN1_9NOCA|nr:hypothetical protein [Rhodococcus tukisamuensis]SDE62791.1 hypothetical protein SAMN05444580_12413 [Rhodococcus tukisamuensis]
MNRAIRVASVAMAVPALIVTGSGVAQGAHLTNPTAVGGPERILVTLTSTTGTNASCRAKVTPEGDDFGLNVPGNGVGSTTFRNLAPGTHSVDITCGAHYATTVNNIQVKAADPIGDFINGALKQFGLTGLMWDPTCC